MDMEKKNYLVTGITGFIGSSLCVELLNQSETEMIYAIARPNGSKTAEQRVIETLSPFFDSSSWQSKLIVLSGDIVKKEFGLSANDYELLKNNVNVIYHCAASISFSLPYEEAQKINCGGTKLIVQLIDDIGLDKFKRLNYVSTAYIAGSIATDFSEHDLSKGQTFFNTYEKTKFECECFLQELIGKGYPITIFRPSIVSSNSVTGYIHKNSIVFTFIALLNQNRIKEFVCDKVSSLNIVPINYVIDSMIALSKKSSSTGKTYHLVNQKNKNVVDMFQTMCKILNVDSPKFITEKAEKTPFAHFYHYAQMSHHFNNEFTIYSLNENIRCPETDYEYIEKKLTYCKNHGLISDNSKKMN